MKIVIECLDNLGDLGSVLLHGYIMHAVEQRIRCGSSSSGCTITEDALAELVARVIVKTWGTNKKTHRLLDDDYDGLVSMLAESIVENVAS